MIFGVAASHSYGEGDVHEYGSGRRITRETQMESSLTTGLPYLRVALSNRMSIWGLLGRGQGTMTFSQEGLGSIETDIAMDMGALGLRHELRQSGSGRGCFDLALKSDVLLLNATADESIALPSLSRDVSRVRLMMEGSRTRKLESGAMLVPSAELGLRHDGGDAETVAEADVGYRLNLFGERARLMPYLGAGLSDHSGQAYRLGARVTVWESLDLDLEGAHRDGAGHLPSGFVLGLRGSFVW